MSTEIKRRSLSCLLDTQGSETLISGNQDNSKWTISLFNLSLTLIATDFHSVNCLALTDACT